MSNVTLQIGGRSFVVACADGEEEHVGELARIIDGKVAALGDVTAQGEARMLLFAALLLADELHEQGRLRPAEPAAAPSPPGDDPHLAERLGVIADRLELLAQRLEQAS